MTFGNVKVIWAMNQSPAYHEGNITNKFRKTHIKINGKRNKMNL